MNTSLNCYLDKTGMAQNGVWETDIEILSASSLLSTDIIVYTKFGNIYKWQKFSRTMLDGKKPENNCSIYLNHTNRIHYDVVIDVFVNQTNQKLFLESVTGGKNNHPKKKIKIGDNLPQTHLQTKQIYQTSSSLQKQTKRSPSKSQRKQAKKTSQMNFTERKTCLKKQTPYKQRVQPSQRTTSKKEVLPTKNNNLDKSAVKNMMKFHKSVHYTIFQCKICYQAWPQKSRKQLFKYVCLACSRDKQQPKRFSKENNVIPSSVPKELQELTQIEEMLIARALPLMRVYVKPGGQRGYSGHCINLPQDISELAESFPRYPKNVPYLVVSMQGKGSNCKEVIGRREKDEKALMWLSKNNHLYKNIKNDQDALNSLPENGIPCDISKLETNSEVDQNLHLSESNSDSDSDDASNVVYKDTQTSSFLSFQQNEKHEHEIIKDKLAEKTISWPPIQKEPFNEYATPFLATMAFPTLFPDGKADPTSPNLNRDVPFNSSIKHLLKFGEFKNGQWNYRFAKHPRFSNWALNMIQRKRTLEQGSIFIKQNPGDAHFTIEQVREMASSNASTVFMSKLSRYVANITGSNAYWHKVRNVLKTIITTKGVPTIFFYFVISRHALARVTFPVFRQI